MANTHTQYKSCAHGYVHINEALYTCELKKTLSISTQNNRCSWMGMWSFNVILACMHACIDRYKLFIHEHVTHTCIHAPIHRICTIRGDELRWQRGGSHELNAW